MPGNFKKEDLRIIKTYKSLLDALMKLLQRRNFMRITINDLCEEAQLSRATFYAHFKDKYDLLEYWLKILKTKILPEDNYASIENAVNQFIKDNAKIISNLLDGADNEVQELLNNFMVSLLEIPAEKDENGKPSRNYIILSNFCAGGMVNLLSWQNKNGFPPELPLINDYLYSLLDFLIKFDVKKIGE